MRPILLAAAAVLGAGQWAVAQSPPSANPVERMAPQAAPQLRPAIQGAPIIEQRGPGQGVPIRVARVEFSGNTALPASVLAERVGALAGTAVPQSRIEEARLAVLRAYRDAGYPFVSVNVGVTPLPDRQSVLRVAVVEGFVAEVRIEGEREAIGPAGAQILRFLQRLVGQRPASAAALERALLLSADVPGMRIGGTVRPLQTEPGALQLVVQVERKPFSGYLNLDTRGYNRVGPFQGLLVGGMNSLTSVGERTELALFGARGDSQHFGQLSSEFFVGGSGLRLRGYAGTGQTRPLGDLRDIGYTGDTQVAGLGASYPVVRSRPFNFYLNGALDLFDTEVETKASGVPTRASMDKVRAVRVGVESQLLENWLSFFPAASTFANLRLHRGLDILGATSTGDLQSGRSGAEDFSFLKMTGEIQRSQPIWSPANGQMINVQGLVAGQWSNDILPQSEKFFLGGSRLNRGFYSGQVTGDRAVSFALELQYDIQSDMPFAVPFGSGRLGTQFYVFRDIGRSFENLETDADRRLSSWGGGVRLTVSDNLQLDLEAANRITTRPDGAAANPLDDKVVISRVLVRY
jgi:hemolysin activation/secretion protein